MNHQINIDEAIAIAKEYHLEAEVTECIKQGMSPIEALIENDNDNISQETFECFTEAIEENPKIDLIKYINQEIGEIGDTQHRIILRYDNEFIPVVKNIIADFNLTNNIKS